MKHRSIVLAIALVTLASCGGEKKDNGTAAEKRLIVMVQSSPTNLDPRVGQDNVSGRIYDLCCRGLIQVTPELDYAPDLAQSWETPDDKTIVFHLNPAAKFHDGRPVTAQDVKWTYDSVMQQKVVNSKASGYSAVDQDRKSTRLNSSHRCISYAVFCLKKKNTPRYHRPPSSL